MDKPLVSIIIPIFNAEKYLEECIQSALDQTYPNTEIILINDGSEDSSLAIANRYECKKIYVFNQENKGASAARNFGLSKANGNYIQFLDADDLLHPEKISFQVQQLKHNVDCISVCPTIHFYDQDSLKDLLLIHDWLLTAPRNPKDFITYLYGGDDGGPRNGGMVQPNAWLTPRSVLRKVGPWDEQLTLDDDGEYFCRVILASSGIVYSKESINYYRKYRTRKNLSAITSSQGYSSQIMAIDLKAKHLSKIIDRRTHSVIFARFYWWAGFSCYPRYLNLSTYCIMKAKALGYTGEKYIGGKNGKILSNLLGWKLARIILEIRKLVSLIGCYLI